MAERMYLLDPLYETETLKLPPSAADLAVMGSGPALSLTGLLATPRAKRPRTCCGWLPPASST